jgi:colanic acid biosynthesis glycosyl transferase WcaI
VTARRLVVHDYSGHPFQVQLSRELARRGHVVHHQYCASHLGGLGDMRLGPHDPPGLTITAIRLRRPFAAYQPVRRVRQEIEYGVRAFRAIRRAHPDVVLLCNVPLIADVLLAGLLTATRTRYILWHQDVHSDAIGQALHRALPRPAARALAAVADSMERLVAWRATRVVAITQEFVSKYEAWHLPKDSYTVIPNWAEVRQFPARAPDRRWLSEPCLRTHVALYSGTLGLKHDPGQLLELARSPALADCSVVVVSEGPGREWLAARQDTVEPGRLVLRDYVPFPQLPEVLASADVLLGILEPVASRFSVPSKIATYLCAGRPVLAVMPPGNAAAQMITASGAGVVLDHSQALRAPEVLRSLLDDPARRQRMGDAGRAFAERQFDIDVIAGRFEDVIRAARA